MDRTGFSLRRAATSGAWLLATVAALFLFAGCGGDEEEHPETGHVEPPKPVAAPEGGVRITRVPGDTEQVFAALGRRCWAFEVVGAAMSYQFRITYREGEKGEEQAVYEASGDDIVRWIASVQAGGQQTETSDGYLVAVLPYVPLQAAVPEEIETAIEAGPFRRVVRRGASEVLPEIFRLPADANEGARLQYGVAGEGEVILEEVLMPGETARLVDYRIKLVPPRAAEAHWLHIELSATCLEEGRLPEHREPLTPEELAERRKEREKAAAEKKSGGHGGGH